MHISAKADYAVRALLELACSDRPLTAEEVAGAQGIPSRFLGSILTDLRRAGLVTSRRGTDGGYRLARPAREISVADVMRATDGPLAEVRGLRPEMTSYTGAAEHLQEVWIATRAALRAVLEPISLDHVARGRLPGPAARFAATSDAWASRRG